MITLPKALEEIGDQAFSGCIALEGKLIAPSGLKKIGKAAFAGCYNIEYARQKEPLEDPVEIFDQTEDSGNENE